MAYAAAVTLLEIVERILNPCLVRHHIPHDKHQIQSLQENLYFLHDFLEDSWQRQGMVVRCLERKIRDSAHKAQDTIESYISQHFQSEKHREIRCKIFVQELEIVMQEIDSIKKKVLTLMDSWDVSTGKSLPTRPPKFVSRDENTMVGFDNDLIQLKDQLTNNQSKLQIIPIIGMGGTGKTTLAKNLYNDDCIVEYFDVRAWVTVSQQYRTRDFLLGLLKSMRELTVEMCQESDEYLEYHLYKSLKGRRYLIIIDDLWTSKVMSEMKRVFPDDCSGSRMVITTRLDDVAVCADSYRPHHHHMHFLSEHESWNLLCRKVFKEEGCPPELEEAGKRIAQSCKGLPLAIVVIAGLLIKVERTQRQWEIVAKNVNSSVIAKDVQCSEILSLSYNHLPHHLRACFLYMGAFPEDQKISVSKLVKLWVAEGFLKPISFKTMEDVATECLEDLISRNLILLGERRADGRIKTCTIHDLLRDLCVRKAEEEKFLHAIPINMHIHSFAEGVKDSRRLTIQGITRDFHMLTGKLSLLRTLLCLKHSKFKIPDELSRCKLLRVLDVDKLDLSLFPIEMLELVHLRYLAFSCKGNFHIPELLPDYLWNLQSLVIKQSGGHGGITGTRVFWRMPQLRHLQIEKVYLDYLAENNDSVLENLQTLSQVTSSNCNKELFKRIPNLKKLGIWLELSGCDAPFSLANLVNLPRLEMLKCVADRGASVSIPMNFTLPQNLKKLTLNGTRIPWKDMSAVGSLPNLEVLKLINDAFIGEEWEPIDGEFCHLKYLLIDGTDLRYWRADRDHFPRLEYLSLWGCVELEEVPCGVGDIPTLKMVELDDASTSAVASAKQIQEEQQSLGNETLQVSILYMMEFIHRKKMERSQGERMQGLYRERIQKLTWLQRWF